VTVLGTEFRLRLLGETDMDRKAMLGSGLLLTVAVVSGAVMVSNSGGEVSLVAEEAAAARPGEAPRRIAEADLGRIAEDTRLALREGDDLQATADTLRRAGQDLLVEYRRRQLEPFPAPAASSKPPPVKGLSDLMRAQMKSVLKTRLKTEVDRLDKLVGLSPDQRKAVEAAYERLFDKIIDSIAEGNVEALEDIEGSAKGLEDELSRILRPDQLERYRKAQEEKAAATRRRQEEENRKAFGAAARAMGLPEDQRLALEPLLAPLLGGLSEKGARLYVKAAMGQIPVEKLKTEQAALIQGVLDGVKDRLTADQLEALRNHAETLMNPRRRTSDPQRKDEDQ
jgi:hypothetical protein